MCKRSIANCAPSTQAQRCRLRAGPVCRCLKGVRVRKYVVVTPVATQRAASLSVMCAVAVLHIYTSLLATGPPPCTVLYLLLRIPAARQADHSRTWMRLWVPVTLERSAFWLTRQALRCPPCPMLYASSPTLS